MVNPLLPQHRERITSSVCGLGALSAASPLVSRSGAATAGHRVVGVRAPPPDCYYRTQSSEYINPLCPSNCRDFSNLLAGVFRPDTSSSDHAACYGLNS